MSDSEHSRHLVQAEREAAGAGVAAMALLSRLIALLATRPHLTKGELREAVDDALLSLEQGQADSPLPQATTCARQCLISVLAMLDGSPAAMPQDTGSR